MLKSHIIESMWAIFKISLRSIIFLSAVLGIINLSYTLKTARHLIRNTKSVYYLLEFT